MNGLIAFLTFLAWAIVFFVLPVLLGVGLCRALRVKEFGGRAAFVLFTIFLGFLPFALKVVQTEAYAYRTFTGSDWVSAADVKDGVDPDTKQPIKVDAKGARVDKKELTSRELKYMGGKWVLVKDPKIEIVKHTTFDLARAKDAIAYGIDLAGGTNLVYELDVANKGDEEVGKDLMERMVAAVTRRINPAGTKEIVVRRVGQIRIEVILPGADPAVVEETKKLMTELGTLEFSIVCNNIDHPDIITAARKTAGPDVVINGKTVAKWRPVQSKIDEQGRKVPNKEFGGNPEIAVREVKGKDGPREEVLVLYESEERKQVTGKLLKRAYPERDSSARPAVGFTFNQIGGFRFHELTSRWQPAKDGRKRQLAVLLNNEIVTAPTLNQPISERGIIESGRFTDKDVKELVMILNAGALPVPIRKTPISEFTISPTLGYDVQSKGKLALWVASIAVVVFMALYYFVAGLVADLALLLNLLFIVAIMAFVKAAFTLPGLAGLVLSAGMAVDANVLIYERMREELARGASLRMAIHNGFDKAFAAIFDSNISTLIAAMILYMVGTETVKGFAVSLFIGLVMNLYTAVFISRLVMNILERSRTIKQVKMMGLIPVSNFDFVGKQVIASAASIVLIAVGMVAFVARGTSNYDIDFTGGHSVTMQFNDKQGTDQVRESLENTFNKNITVEELTPFDASSTGKHFRLRIANEGGKEISKEDVESKINSTFPGMLTKIQLTTIGDFETIPTADAEKSDGSTAQFAGGHKLALTFNNDIAPATFGRSLQEQLQAIGGEGAKKYPDAESLFLLEGTAGKGMTVADGKVRIYTAMTLLASPKVAADDLKAALTAVQQKMETIPLFDEVTSFESSVASETKTSALIAIIVSLIALIIYVWFRFENLVFGLAAVIALAHDVLVSLGCVALAGYAADTAVGKFLLLNDFKINMAMIAAFLTIVGYSLNDTIVIFDRLREIRGKNPVINKDMINLTVNQTLSRTILTALTVFITVVILYALGGEGIHGFAFCMVIGSIAGTYSTVYIASPLVLVFMRNAPLPAGPRRPSPGMGGAQPAA
ncbi:MAG: protein translocase subunit SecD [Planctomycetia bacterium]|nr:protein translocase subunit SecD [Planctomycetia bacterium]